MDELLSVNGSADFEWLRCRVAGCPAGRKYYELTAAGRDALADAMKRHRLLEQKPIIRACAPKSSRV
jgi:hypothetical protein